MKKSTIIYFGNDWFGENKTSSHHISDRLANQYNLLYVECPGLRMPQGNKRDFRKLFAKVIKSISKPRKIREHFWVYTLFQVVVAPIWFQRNQYPQLPKFYLQARHQLRNNNISIN